MTEDLQKLGLTEYEAKAYTALLSEGTSTGSAISRNSGVPQGKIYETLAKLVSKGLVLEKPTDPKQFQPVAPEISIKRLVEEKTADLEGAAEKAIASLKDLKNPLRKEAVSDMLTSFEGREQSFRLGEAMFERAKKEIKVISVGERIPYSLLRAAKAAISRGAIYRFIATKYHEDNRAILREFASIGMAVRYSQMQGFSLVITDRKEALITLRKPEYPKVKESIGFHISSPDLSNALADYFDITWKKASKVDLS